MLLLLLCSSSPPQRSARSNSSFVRGSSQRSASSIHQSEVERGEEEAVSELLAAAAATQRSLSHGEEEGKGLFGTGDENDRGLAGAAGTTVLALLKGPPKSAESVGNLPAAAPLGAAAAVVAGLIIALLQV